MLDAKMRTAIGLDPDQRPVPSPDRAVVKPEMPERSRWFVEFERQENRVASEVFGKQLEQRSVKITSAEADALHAPAARKIHRLLKEGNSGLVPKVLAEQEGRVARGRYERP